MTQIHDTLRLQFLSSCWSKLMRNPSAKIRPPILCITEEVCRHWFLIFGISSFILGMLTVAARQHFQVVPSVLFVCLCFNCSTHPNVSRSALISFPDFISLVIVFGCSFWFIFLLVSLLPIRGSSWNKTMPLALKHTPFYRSYTILSIIITIILSTIMYHFPLYTYYIITMMITINISFISPWYHMNKPSVLHVFTRPGDVSLALLRLVQGLPSRLRGLWRGLNCLGLRALHRDAAELCQVHQLRTTRGGSALCALGCLGFGSFGSKEWDEWDEHHWIQWT